MGGSHVFVSVFSTGNLRANRPPPKEQVEQLRYAKRHPTIKDDVTIYAGATVLGGETVIGAGSIIGGSVWITRSVPSGTKVFLAPPKLVYENSES